MQTIIIRRSEINKCLSPDLFLKQCFKCGRYDTCNYPEKVVNEKFDYELRKARVLTKLAKRKFKQLKRRNNQ